MALPTTALGLNEINQHVDGNTGPLYNITDNADLNASDVRAWGNANNLSAYNYGSAGTPTGSGTEIAMGEFRGASAPTTAFSGTMTTRYIVVYSGDAYIPNAYYSGFSDGTVQGPSNGLGSHTNTSFSGSIAGRNATHTLRNMINIGIGSASGQIEFCISNPTGAYTATSTAWTSVYVQRGSGDTWARTSAASVTATYNSTYGYLLRATWGSFFGAPGPNAYSMSQYWGTGSFGINRSMYVNL